MSTQASFHYLQYHAQRMVKLALYHGDLIRIDECEYCHSKDKTTHAHHEDYSKPLSVVWLCPTCHYNIHHFDKVFNPRAVKAADRVIKYLTEHPEAIHQNALEIAAILEVGKSTVYNVIKEIKGLAQ